MCTRYILLCIFFDVFVLFVTYTHNFHTSSLSVYSIITYLLLCFHLCQTLLILFFIIWTDEFNIEKVGRKILYFLHVIHFIFYSTLLSFFFMFYVFFMFYFCRATITKQSSEFSDSKEYNNNVPCNIVYMCNHIIKLKHYVAGWCCCCYFMLLFSLHLFLLFSIKFWFINALIYIFALTLIPQYIYIYLLL